MKRLFYHTIILLIAAWLSLSASSPLYGEEDIASDTMLMFVGEELHTITAASRRKESLRKAPAAVTVLGKKELKRYRTLAEALKAVPGFYLDHSGRKEEIYLRGVADSFLVMIDGVPLANDASNVDYPRGLELALDYVEKVEIVRGPGSALWGADAFSGVINVVTQSGKDFQKTKVTGRGGSFDSGGGTLLTGYEFANVDFLLFGSLFETKGFEPDHSGNIRSKDAFKEFYGKATIHDRLTVSGRYSRYNDYYTINFLDRHTGLNRTPFSFIQVSYNDRFWERVDAAFQLYANYFRNYQKDSWRFVIPEFNLAFPVATRFSQSNWRYGFQAKFDAPWRDKHLLTLGASWEYDDGSSAHNSFNGLDVPLLPGFQNYRLGFYLQDKYLVTDELEITAGVRCDKHEEYRRKISPRFSLVWLPEKWLDVKFFYGQAFRTPDIFALSRAESAEPEEIESFESELTLRWRQTVLLRTNYFYYVLSDLLENVTQGLLSQDKREVEQGTELTLAISPMPNLSLYANHTFLFGERQRNDPRRVTFEFELPGIPGGGLSVERVFHMAPDHTLKLGASYVWLKRYTANVEVNYVDSRDIDEDFYGVSESSLGHYWTTDVNLLAEGIWEGRVDCALKIRNIFNERFKYRGENELFRGPERNLLFELSWSF